MTASPTRMALLRETYRRLDPAQPIDPATQAESYEPLYAKNKGDTDSHKDPIERLLTHIEWASPGEPLFFSGYNGTGKSTELFRLRKLLAKKGYFVVYIDTKEYLRAAASVDINTVLITIAGGLSDELAKIQKIDLADKSFWARFTDYLNRTAIEVNKVSVEANATTPAQSVFGGLRTGLKLEAQLRDGGSFLKSVRELLKDRIAEVQQQTAGFIQDAIAAIAQKTGKATQLVLLVDQLELLGSFETDPEATVRAFDRLFHHHQNRLGFAQAHVVYTVPAWLTLLRNNGLKVEMLSTRQLWKRDPARPSVRANLRLFRSLVRRRLGEDALLELFGIGPDDTSDSVFELVDQIIAASGGHLRDLIRILRDLLTFAKDAPLPVQAPLVKAAIQSVRSDYLPLNLADARRLSAIAGSFELCQPDATHESVVESARLLNLHLVLNFLNGESWYDVHPLIRDEVAKLAPLAKPAEPAAAPTK